MEHTHIAPCTHPDCISDWERLPDLYAWYVERAAAGAPMPDGLGYFDPAAPLPYRPDRHEHDTESHRRHVAHTDAERIAFVARERFTRKPVVTTPQAHELFEPLGVFLDSATEAESWLVEGLLPARGMSIWVSRPKVGKTTYARALAVATAQGKPWLGRDVERGGVLYLAMDRDPRFRVQEHFRTLGARDTDPIHYRDASLPGHPTTWASQLRAVVEHYKPALIVIDTMSRFMLGEDVGDYATMTKGLQPLLDIAHDCNTHVAILHHSPKGESEDATNAALGSIAIAGTADSILVFRRTPHGRTLETIQRIGAELVPTVLVLDTQGQPHLAGTVAGRAEAEMTDRVLAYLEGTGPTAQPDLLAALDGGKPAIMKALRQLERAGAVFRSGSGKKGSPYLWTAVPEADRKPTLKLVPDVAPDASDAA